MQFKVLRGRNQRGLCFASTEGEEIKKGLYSLKKDARAVISEIRLSKKVPKGHMVLDSVLYDFLDCNPLDLVSIEVFSEEIPQAKEVSFKVSSSRLLDNMTIAEALSNRSEGLSNYLNGLVLLEGQQIPLTTLGVDLQVTNLRPSSPLIHAARISWPDLLKVKITPLSDERIKSSPRKRDAPADNKQSDSQEHRNETEQATPKARMFVDEPYPSLDYDNASRISTNISRRVENLEDKISAIEMSALKEHSKETSNGITQIKLEKLVERLESLTNKLDQTRVRLSRLQEKLEAK